MIKVLIRECWCVGAEDLKGAPVSSPTGRMKRDNLTNYFPDGVRGADEAPAFIHAEQTTSRSSTSQAVSGSTSGSSTNSSNVGTAARQLPVRVWIQELKVNGAYPMFAVMPVTVAPGSQGDQSNNGVMYFMSHVSACSRGYIATAG